MLWQKCKVCFTFRKALGCAVGNTGSWYFLPLHFCSQGSHWQDLAHVFDDRDRQRPFLTRNMFKAIKRISVYRWWHSLHIMLRPEPKFRMYALCFALSHQTQRPSHSPVPLYVFQNVVSTFSHWFDCCNTAEIWKQNDSFFSLLTYGLAPHIFLLVTWLGWYLNL